MTTVKRDINFQGGFDELLCQKISIAIKKSNIFAHVNLSELIRKRFINANNNEVCDVPPSKKCKPINEPIPEVSNDKEIPKDNLCRSPILNDFLPNPDTLFSQSTPNPSNKSVKSECILKENSSVSRNVYLLSSSIDLSNLQPPHSIAEINVSRLSLPNNEIEVNTTLDGKDTKSISNVNFSKTNLLLENREKSPKRDGVRGKQNKDLSNLATSLLPLPTQLFGKDSMLSALESGEFFDFLNFFKEGIQIDKEISADDLTEIIEMIVKKKAFSIISGFISCLMNNNMFIEPLTNSLVKYKSELSKYKIDILKCVESMTDFKIVSSINFYIKACSVMNYWDRMWFVLSSKCPGYMIPETYFNSFMNEFDVLDKSQPMPINSETMTIIIPYISRMHPSKKVAYLTEIWLYCIYYDINNKELNSMDLEISQQSFDKIIDKLNNAKDPSFLFGMKILIKNWNLIHNYKFSEWFSKLISDKSDVRKCLFSIKDSIHALNRNVKQEIFDNFNLLVIRVMSYLNKKSLFTCSKTIYENFLKNVFSDIKRALYQVNDKFKLKWTMVECLVSSAEYEKALFIIKEFEVLKDLEVISPDYNRVKEILPNLVWHLINSSETLPVIVLFEQVISIFIFNENIDNAYTKNCNEIFDLIVIKAYESNNCEVVRKMISLLDLILSADIDFDISKDSLRYLAIAAVRTNIPFKELLDFVDVCFKFDIFENIQTAEDGFGSFVGASSNLTHEEIIILVTWMCRHVKIKLVQSVQNQGSTIRENIMKVCSIKFILHASTNSDSFCKNINSDTSFNEFLKNFTEALNNPKYLKHPIKFSTISDTSDNVMKIVCDNRIVYNTIYYSDI